MKHEMCDNIDFSFLVTAGLFLQPRPVATMESCASRARMLRRVNIESLRAWNSSTFHGMTDEEIAEACGVEPLPDYTLETYHHERQYFEDQSISLIDKIRDVAKAIAYYENRALHCPDWQNSSARAYCHRLLSRWVARLPGYDTAPAAPPVEKVGAGHPFCKNLA